MKKGMVIIPFNIESFGDFHQVMFATMVQTLIHDDLYLKDEFIDIVATEMEEDGLPWDTITQKVNDMVDMMDDSFTPLEHYLKPFKDDLRDASGLHFEPMPIDSTAITFFSY